MHFEGKGVEEPPSLHRVAIWTLVFILGITAWFIILGMIALTHKVV